MHNLIKIVIFTNQPYTLCTIKNVFRANYFDLVYAGSDNVFILIKGGFKDRSTVKRHIYYTTWSNLNVLYYSL